MFEGDSGAYVIQLLNGKQVCLYVQLLEKLGLGNRGLHGRGEGEQKGRELEADHIFQARLGDLHCCCRFFCYHQIRQFSFAPI